MNEVQKTGLFAGVAVVMVALATFISIPSGTETSEDDLPGTILFQSFQDPSVATQMKIVTFDDEQGQLDTFAVRKDSSTGLWQLPSRDGYPADAIEQMRDAANSLIGIKVLDVQTSNAEDHDDLGVIEPEMKKLQVGDEGVGRLVTFEDEKQNKLASLIIGNPVKDDETKRYVRIPNQNPVYVVKFDDAPLTTKFTDWIEDDLLQLSSIDIKQVEIKDYTATLGGQGISLARDFAATVNQEGSDWELGQLLEYDKSNAMAEPKKVDPKEGEELDATKLNEMKNALDDLKIVGVFRKPEGVSATLKASESLMNNQDAVTSLAQRGFYPVDMGPNGEADILSANGEMSVSLQDGVQYLLRFGNIAGMTSEQEKAESDSGESEGVNRYLFVTTQVNEANFPTPDLQPIPQTLDELDALLNPKPVEEAKPEPAPTADASEDAAEMKEEESEEEVKKEEMKDSPEGEASEEGDASPDEAKEDSADEDSADKDNAEENAGEEAEMKKEEEPASSDQPAESDGGNKEEGAKKEDNQEPAAEGETEVSGAGEATGAGQAQQDDEAAEDEVGEPAEDAATDEAGTDDAAPDAAVTEEKEATMEGGKEENMVEEKEELSEDEKLELLEAEQEKITKANQRKIDARNDKMKAAKERVEELNERFADWYYVIPESTYAELKITREELFKSEAEDAVGPPANPLQGGPQMQIPGFPQN